MKKRTLVLLSAIFAIILVGMTLPALLVHFMPIATDTSDTSETTSDTSSDTSSESSSESSSEEESEPLYQRVEVERYDVYITAPTVGTNYTKHICYKDISTIGSNFANVNPLSGSTLLYSFSSTDVSFYIHAGYLSTSFSMKYFDILPGQYGAYHFTDVIDDALVYTVDPIYEYVLVE